MMGDLMSECLTLSEHAEFAKRIDEENRRQNARLDSLEKTVKEIERLTVSVERMAVSLENMSSEQKKQGERLMKIEEKPAKKWDNLTATIISSFASGIIGIIIGLISAGVIK